MEDPPLNKRYKNLMDRDGEELARSRTHSAQHLHRARMRLKKVLSENCVFYRNEDNELACDRNRIDV